MWNFFRRKVSSSTKTASDLAVDGNVPQPNLVKKELSGGTKIDGNRSQGSSIIPSETSLSWTTPQVSLNSTKSEPQTHQGLNSTKSALVTNISPSCGTRDQTNSYNYSNTSTNLLPQQQPTNDFLSPGSSYSSSNQQLNLNAALPVRLKQVYDGDGKTNLVGEVTPVLSDKRQISPKSSFSTTCETTSQGTSNPQALPLMPFMLLEQPRKTQKISPITNVKKQTVEQRGITGGPLTWMDDKNKHSVMHHPLPSTVLTSSPTRDISGSSVTGQQQQCVPTLQPLKTVLLPQKQHDNSAIPYYCQVPTLQPITCAAKTTDTIKQSNQNRGLNVKYTPYHVNEPFESCINTTPSQARYVNHPHSTITTTMMQQHPRLHPNNDQGFPELPVCYTPPPNNINPHVEPYSQHNATAVSSPENSLPPTSKVTTVYVPFANEQVGIRSNITSNEGETNKTERPVFSRSVTADLALRCKEMKYVTEPQTFSAKDTEKLNETLLYAMQQQENNVVTFTPNENRNANRRCSNIEGYVEVTDEVIEEHTLAPLCFSSKSSCNNETIKQTNKKLKTDFSPHLLGTPLEGVNYDELFNPAHSTSDCIKRDGNNVCYNDNLASLVFEKQVGLKPNSSEITRRGSLFRHSGHQQKDNDGHKDKQPLQQRKVSLQFTPAIQPNDVVSPCVSDKLPYNKSLLISKSQDDNITGLAVRSNTPIPHQINRFNIPSTITPNTQYQLHRTDNISPSISFPRKNNFDPSLSYQCRQQTPQHNLKLQTQQLTVSHVSTLPKQFTSGNHCFITNNNNNFCQKQTTNNSNSKPSAPAMPFYPLISKEVITQGNLKNNFFQQQIAFAEKSPGSNAPNKQSTRMLPASLLSTYSVNSASTLAPTTTSTHAGYLLPTILPSRSAVSSIGIPSSLPLNDEAVADQEAQRVNALRSLCSTSYCNVMINNESISTPTTIYSPPPQFSHAWSSPPPLSALLSQKTSPIFTDTNSHGKSQKPLPLSQRYYSTTTSISSIHDKASITDTDSQSHTATQSVLPKNTDSSLTTAEKTLDICNNNGALDDNEYCVVKKKPDSYLPTTTIVPPTDANTNICQQPSINILNGSSLAEVTEVEKIAEGGTEGNEHMSLSSPPPASLLPISQNSKNVATGMHQDKDHKVVCKNNDHPIPLRKPSLTTYSTKKKKSMMLPLAIAATTSKIAMPIKSTQYENKNQGQGGLKSKQLSDKKSQHLAKYKKACNNEGHVTLLTPISPTKPITTVSPCEISQQNKTNENAVMFLPPEQRHTTNIMLHDSITPSICNNKSSGRIGKNKQLFPSSTSLIRSSSPSPKNVLLSQNISDEGDVILSKHEETEQEEEEQQQQKEDYLHHKATTTLKAESSVLHKSQKRKNSLLTSSKDENECVVSNSSPLPPLSSSSETSADVIMPNENESIRHKEKKHVLENLPKHLSLTATTTPSSITDSLSRKKQSAFKDLSSILNSIITEQESSISKEHPYMFLSEEEQEIRLREGVSQLLLDNNDERSINHFQQKQRQDSKNNKNLLHKSTVDLQVSQDELISNESIGMPSIDCKTLNQGSSISPSNDPNDSNGLLLSMASLKKNKINLTKTSLYHVTNKINCLTLNDYTKILHHLLDTIIPLSAEGIVTYPRDSLIKRRDKELRKIKAFGWKYASSELQAIYPSLSRFTQQHRCDVQRGRVEGSEKRTLVCQAQLLAQITYGLQPRDVFGYYFRLGVSAGESITNRLNRYADKRRIQNSCRRFLEFLLLNEDIIKLCTMQKRNQRNLSTSTNKTDDDTVWIQELNCNILLPEFLDERQNLLTQIFQLLVSQTKKNSSEDRCVSESSDDELEMNPSLSLENFLYTLNDLNLWPSETNNEDRHEIVISFLMSNPNLITSFALSEPIPQTVTSSMFNDALSACPYNLPDFPAPTLFANYDSNRTSLCLSSSDLINGALKLCRVILDVDKSSAFAFKREAEAMAAAQYSLNIDLNEQERKESDDPPTNDLARRIGLCRLAELDAKGFEFVGYPPKFFKNQDLLMSNILSIEELQTLLILYDSKAQHDLHSSKISSPLWDTRVITRCLNIIIGLTKELAREEDWAFVLNPFVPENSLPNIKILLHRCYNYCTLTLPAIQKKALNHQHTNENIMSTTTKLMTMSSHAKVVPESLFLQNNFETQSTVTSSQNSLNIDPVDDNPVPSIAIDWKSFLEPDNDELLLDVEKKDNNKQELWSTDSSNNDLSDNLTTSSSTKPLLLGPLMDKGVHDLWISVTLNADSGLTANAANDPSGYLPLDLTPLQVCCTLFEFLIINSHCFDNLNMS